MRLSRLAIAEAIEVEEDITLKNIVTFQMYMENFLARSTQFMMLNLQNVHYLNNSALKIIASTAIAASKKGKELVLVGVLLPIDEIFHLLKFYTFIKQFATCEEALHYFVKYKK